MNEVCGSLSVGSFGVPHWATIVASCLDRPSSVGAPRLTARRFFALHFGDPVAGRVQRRVWLEQDAAVALTTAQLVAVSFEVSTAWASDVPSVDDAPEVTAAHQADGAVGLIHTGFSSHDQAHLRSHHEIGGRSRANRPSVL
jgi:hypothetical protein